MFPHTRFSRTVRFGACALLVSATLTACGTTSANTEAKPTAATSAAAPTTASAAPAKAAVTFTDAWAKSADSGMSAIFGNITNNSDKAVTLVSSTTAASKSTQLHETLAVSGKQTMREKTAGFTIEPGQTLELAPGGNHIMLMELTGALKAGQTIPVTLTFAAGDPVQEDVLVKDFAGTGEHYDHGSEDMGSMSSESTHSHS